VGVDIVDWGFLKRAHLMSIKGALIMDLVIALTVLVDLIAAVGIGVFIANIMTIDKLSSLQAKSVKSISMRCEKPSPAWSEPFGTQPLGMRHRHVPFLAMQRRLRFRVAHGGQGAGWQLSV
jgi:MFS superfamily sulfate permease-like transporter